MSLAFVTPAQADEGSSPVDMRKSADAGVDRTLVLPSAETLYEGDFTVNSYQLLMLGFSYGLTDKIELSATTLIPAFEDIPVLLFVGGKFQLVRMPNFIFSIQGNAGFVHFLEDSDGSAGSIGAGFLADIVLDSQGKYVFSISNQNTWNFASGSDIGFFVLSFAFNARVAEIVKILVEFVIPGGFTDSEFELVEEATVFNYGVRFFGKTIAVDLSFLLPVHPDIDIDPLIIGVPYIAFSARF